MGTIQRIVGCAVGIWLFCGSPAAAKEPHHYIFFNREKTRIQDKSFLTTPGIEGAQLKFTWKELEPEKDGYDFSSIREALAFLTSHGKKLFIQLQDASFDPSIVLVPRYLQRQSDYHGGANQQYNEETAKSEGWVARRWDPAVQERLYKLFAALGKEFDGRIEGINLAETSIGFGKTGERFPKDFSNEGYRDAIIANLRALKQAFSKSVVMQYANFMPGEWLPEDDKGYLKSVYAAAKGMKAGVGGPDLLPYRRGQLNHAYPLIRAAAGLVPTGIAAQEGNYEHQNPKTGKHVSVAEMEKFAANDLKVDYIFWSTQEPFYSRDVLPMLSQQRPSRAAVSTRRQVAVTFDDLPFQGPQPDIATLKGVTEKVLRSITLHHVPVFADVNEEKLYLNGKLNSARVDILRMWLDAGAELGNHTYAHADFHATTLPDFEAQVIRGEAVTRHLMQERGMKPRYFRHPVLHVGFDAGKKQAFERFLAQHGYAVAPVTIDNQDFMFAGIYAKAKKRGDTATMRRVADAYIPYMEKMFGFYENLSWDSLGYEIRQVLLLHANELNADMFDDLAGMMERRGYAFITLEDALKDKAYSLPDAPAKKGLSWLHRWMLAKGEKMTEEPGEPAFIAQLFRSYPAQARTGTPHRPVSKPADRR